MIESDKSVRFGEEVADKVKENINANVSDAFSLRTDCQAKCNTFSKWTSYGVR